MISLTSLSTGYGKRIALKSFTCNINKGSLTSIIGPNGCGKTTLLKTIVGIFPKFSGDITVDGENVDKLKRSDIAKKLAYLAQQRRIPDMTVWDMVLHGRYPYLTYPKRYSDRDREIAATALGRVGLTELADAPLSTLSGGMRQKAYIAMSLAQDTDYILLDEPTTFLDTAHRLDVMRILRSLADEGRGIVCVMHDLPLAFAFSDAVTVMKGGELIITGTPDEICASTVTEELFGVKVFSDGGDYFYKIHKE